MFFFFCYFSGYITEDELRCRSYQRAYEFGVLQGKAYSKDATKTHTFYNFCFIENVDICRIHPQELYSDYFGALYDVIYLLFSIISYILSFFNTFAIDAAKCAAF